MSVDKVINIKVNDSELDGLEQNLNQVATGFDKVDTEASKAARSVDDVASNGGAIAVLDRLTGGLATQFKDAFEASKLFNISLKAQRVALIASGIGVFVVILGTVAAYWSDIVEFITSANKLLQKQIDLNNKNLEALDFELKLLDEKLKVLELEGESTEEIKKQKEAIILLQQEENALLLDNLKTQLLRQEAQIKEVTIWEEIKIAATGALLGAEERAKALAKALVGDENQRTRLDEITKQINDATLRTETLKIALLTLNKPVDSSGNVTQDRSILNSVSEIEAQNELNSTKVDIEQELFDNLLGIRTNFADLTSALDQQELNNAQLLADARVGIAQNTLALIGQIAGEGSAVGKAVAVAQATISGIEGVQNAFSTASKSPITTLFPAYPFIQAGLAGAFSALQIKKILSVDPTGKSAPSVGSGGGSAPAAPSFNVVGTSGVNQLAQTLNQDQQPVRAFVVGSDVTTQQEMDRQTTETATIG